MRHYAAHVLATLVLCSFAYAASASAQAEQPAAPAPAAQPAPAAPSGPPPSGYPPQGGYYPQQPQPYGYYPPPGWYYQQPPATLPYRANEPIPQGYRLEKRPRTGLIIAGAVVTAVPYFIGLSVASANKFHNAGGFLAIPALGPWLTLAARENTTCDYVNNSGFTSSYCGADDAAIVTVLVLDALIQTTGAILFVIGVASDRELLVRQDVAKLRFTPLKFDHGGYGLGVHGGF